MADEDTEIKTIFDAKGDDELDPEDSTVGSKNVEDGSNE